MDWAERKIYTHKRLDFPFCTARIVRLYNMAVQKFENLNGREYNHS